MSILRWKAAARNDAPVHAPVREPGGAAFEDLAMPLAASLYNTAHWLSGNAADAEDLVQETFFKALRGYSSFEQGTNFKAWIFRILRNSFLSSKAGLAAVRTVSLDEEIDESGQWGEAIPEGAIERQTPETNLLRMADRAALERAMKQLPKPMLEVILLCDVEEMSYREIATILDVPAGTVMSRLSRARAALRAAMIENSNSPRQVRP